ncbi:hypothetical protein ANN_09749 [Periplaneta americana]|uniref:Uncharacterized protein n=1 Tax=Periplaneta americana TaxID=6978 RepID=A0ABQ8TNM8_PERAM|nr:hypothetical protein ANN_09749 [Periplaneta americana]
MFPGRIISRFGDIAWPPRSPDLTAADYFLRGYLKSRVYRNKPRTIIQLKQNIRNEINAINLFCWGELCRTSIADCRNVFVGVEITYEIKATKRVVMTLLKPYLKKQASAPSPGHWLHERFSANARALRRSSAGSDPVFAFNELRKNPEKKLNHVTCPSQDLNPDTLVSRSGMLTVPTRLRYISELNSTQLTLASYWKKLLVELMERGQGKQEYPEKPASTPYLSATNSTCVGRDLNLDVQRRNPFN